MGELCPTCSGMGDLYDDPHHWRLCPTCKGSGEVTAEYRTVTRPASGVVTR